MLSGFPQVTDYGALTWPSSLRSEVDKYGPERVYETGVRLLGYPPQWAHTKREFETLFNALENGA